MNNTAVEQTKDPLLEQALRALQRAAKQARRLAVQTGTAIIIMRDSQMQRVYPNEVQENGADYSGKS